MHHQGTIKMPHMPLRFKMPHTYERPTSLLAVGLELNPYFCFPLNAHPRQLFVCP